MQSHKSSTIGVAAHPKNKVRRTCYRFRTRLMVHDWTQPATGGQDLRTQARFDGLDLADWRLIESTQEDGMTAGPQDGATALQPFCQQESPDARKTGDMRKKGNPGSKRLSSKEDKIRQNIGSRQERTTAFVVASKRHDLEDRVVLRRLAAISSVSNIHQLHFGPIEPPVGHTKDPAAPAT